MMIDPKKYQRIKRNGECITGMLVSEADDGGMCHAVDYSIDLAEDWSIFIDFQCEGGAHPLAKVHIHLSSDGVLTLCGGNTGGGDFRNEVGGVYWCDEIQLLPVPVETEDEDAD